MTILMPKLILILSLLSWGWLNQQWLHSLLLLLMFFSSLLTAWRWQIKQQQFYRIGDLVTFMLLLLVIYFSLFQSEQKTVFVILKWLPLFFAPVLLAQLFSSQGVLPLGTLFYSMRKRPLKDQTRLEFSIPYAAIVLLSASAAQDETSTYFLLTVLIVWLILWTARPKKESLLLWIAVLAFCTVTAFFMQQQLFKLQTVLEDKAVDWLTNWQTDPFKSTTSIGEIGDLKLSEKIEFRLKADKFLLQPMLLQQASYDRYMGQTWYASQRVFRRPDFSQQQVQSSDKQLSFFQQLKPESIMALPAGTVAIKGLEGARLQQTALGVVKLSEAPDFANYQIFYNGRQTGHSTAFDLQLPDQHQNWIRLIKQQLKLENKSKHRIAQGIKLYFQTHYFYSLFLGLDLNADQALQRFILQRKAGHCEYFAVATVFLLRSYGIPARLANGYVMQEYDESEDLYIVRRRHAHAWAIAYIDGQWQSVDSTPAQWLEMEEDNVGLLQPVYDWFSSIQFNFKQWRYQQALVIKQQNDSWLWAVAGLLTVYLFWRLYSSRRQLQRPNRPDPAQSQLTTFPGQDSELFLIEQLLSDTEYARLKHESVVSWARRIDNKELISICRLHYHYRFDPKGITQQQREQLKKQVSSCLKNIKRI